MSSDRQIIHAEGAPAAVGPYVHAIRSGDLLFCSGAIPLDPETDELVSGGPGPQTTRCLRNIATVCQAAGTDLARAVQMTVYTTDLGAGPEINDAYADAFSGDPPTRAMVEVAGLPAGAQVEIVAVVAIG